MRNRNRFDNYREIMARRDGPADCHEGHNVKAGESIGWNGGLRKVYCAACWQVWKAENAEAQAYEDRYSYCSDGYGY